MEIAKVLIFGGLVAHSCLAFNLDNDRNRHLSRLVPSAPAAAAPQLQEATRHHSDSPTPPEEKNTGDLKNRRSFVSGAFATLLLPAVVSTSLPDSARASDVRAPLELLRPATRTKLFIDRAIDILLASSDGKKGGDKKLERLKGFFDAEPAFMTPEEETLSKRYLQIKTSAAWQNARLKELEAKGAEMGVDYTTPYDKLNTAIQQWGDNSQFRILRGRQRDLERSSPMRAAFNAYTNNLVFGDAYRLNAEGDARRALIRSDALPSVNSVVVSDLDLRDLYRNQVLQNMDDARAELEYQLKSSNDEVDVEEILVYLKQARSSCQEWFNFIPKSDVEAALQSVLAEAAE